MGKDAYAKALELALREAAKSAGIKLDEISSRNINSKIIGKTMHYLGKFKGDQINKDEIHIIIEGLIKDAIHTEPGLATKHSKIQLTSFTEDAINRASIALCDEPPDR